MHYRVWLLGWVRCLFGNILYHLDEFGHFGIGIGTVSICQRALYATVNVPFSPSSVSIAYKMAFSSGSLAPSKRKKFLM
jgi:hypothetical protein